MKMSLSDAVKYLIIALLSAFLVVDIIAFSMLIAANKVLLDPETYINELERSNLYDGVVESVVDLLFEGKDVAELENLSINITKERAKVTIINAFPREWRKRQVDGLIESFVLYMKGERDELELSINLKETKPNIQVAVSQLANETLEENMPILVDRLIDQQIGEYAQKNDMPCETLRGCREFCKGAETGACEMYMQMTEPENLNILRKNLTAMFDLVVRENISNFIVSEIPDEIDIAHELREENAIEIVDGMRDMTGSIPTLTNALSVVAILLVILIALLAHNLRKAALFVGIPLMISGVIGLLGFYLLPGFVTNALDNIPEQEIGIVAVIRDIIMSISTKFLKEEVLYTTAAGLVGLILMLSYFILQASERQFPSKSQ